jgi:uncharacterized protein (DUF1778 family)
MSSKNYTNELTVRFTDDEKRQVSSNAEAAGLSVSRFLAKAGTAEAAILTEEHKELLKALRFEVRKVGTNLNQIAREINAARLGSGETPDPNQLKDALKNFNALIEAINEHL